MSSNCFETLQNSILRYESDICDAPVIAFEEGADVMRTANALNCIITQFMMFNVCDVISQASGIAALAILMSGAWEIDAQLVFEFSFVLGLVETIRFSRS